MSRAPHGMAKVRAEGDAPMPADPISTANAAVAQITSAIRQAAQAVGTSFSYLLATAKVESNFSADAKASTSTAQGLFQFIEQTWLSTMKDAGPQLGYSNYADAIVRTPSGRMAVPDPAMRQEILGLRSDPDVNAAMAGAFTNSNAAILKARLGRAPTEGELYIAHFLGAGGAEKLINAASTSNPPAARLFPAAASANPSIFYDKAGRSRSASEVYSTLTGRYQVARAGTTAMAAAGAPARVAVVPDPAATTQALAASQPARPRSDSGPVFYALFQTGEQQEALAVRVNQLWTRQPAPAPAQAAGAQPVQQAATGRPLDLFQDMPPDIRGLFTGRG